MAFFQPLGTTKEQIQELLYDTPHTNSYVGIKALSNSDVLTAVSIIAGDIARFPIIKKDFDGNIVQDSKLNYLMNVKSTEKTTAHMWKFAMVVNAILCGNSYSRILRDPKTNEPLEYEFYPPSAVSIESDNQFESYYYMFYPQNGNKQIKCEPDDVIHWKFFTTDTIYGRSPLLSLGDEINLQDSGIATLLKFFRDGFSSGILHLKGGQLSPEARTKARKEFEKSRQGSTGGSPIVMDSTMEYTPLEVDTNVLGLINSNNYSTAQIAKCLRVPAHKLAVTNPNQSIKQLNDDYILNDLPYYFNAITSEHQLKMFDDVTRREFTLEFDTRSVTGMNPEEALKLYNGGLITGDQALMYMGKSPTDDADMQRRKFSLNYVWEDKAEQYQLENKGKRKGGDEIDEERDPSKDDDNSTAPVGE